MGQLVIKLCSGLIRSHSFESGVVEEGNIENMQGNGSWGPELRNTALGRDKTHPPEHHYYMVPKLFEGSIQISDKILSPIQLKWHKSQQSSTIYSLVNCITTFDCYGLISYELVHLFGITVQVYIRP